MMKTKTKINNTFCKNVADKILSGVAKYPLKMSVVADLYIRYWQANFIFDNDEENDKLDTFYIFLSKLQKDSGVLIIDDDNFMHGTDEYGREFIKTGIKPFGENVDAEFIEISGQPKMVKIKLTDSKYLKKLKKQFK